jgi:hypothetical protein
MNILEHIYESLEQFFGLKYLNSVMRLRIRIRDPGIFFTLDPGWKKFRSVIRYKHSESATLLDPDPYSEYVSGSCNTVNTA